MITLAGTSRLADSPGEWIKYTGARYGNEWNRDDLVGSKLVLLETVKIGSNREYACQA